MIKRILMAAVVSFGMTAFASSATTLNWALEATVDNFAGSDTLGIDGQKLTLNLYFDDTDEWSDASAAGLFYFDTISASVSLTGGNSISLGSTTPVAFAQPIGSTTSYQAGFAQESNSVSFIDFNIEGIFFEGQNFADTILGALPAPGSNLSDTQLISSLSGAVNGGGSSCQWGGAKVGHLVVRLGA